MTLHSPVVCSLIVLASIAVEKCITVRLTNCYARTVTVTYGPVTLCAEAQVQRDPQHRWLEMSLDYASPDAFADSDPLYEIDTQDGPVPASLIQLDGADARLRYERKYRDLSGGTYVLTGTTYADESRQQICGRATARVIVR